MNVPADDTKIREQETRDKAIKELVRYKLNGREISNAINSARTLARFEGAQLDMPHIRRVGICRNIPLTMIRTVTSRRLLASSLGAQGSL